jgi:Ca2+-binding RTX toxin-like protein
VIKLAGDGDGTGAGEALLGTDLDDFLIGGRGRDRFTPGKGNDAISGEGGRDTIILPGTPADYSLTKDGDLYRLTGQGGAGQGVDVRFRGIALLGFLNPQGDYSLMPVEDFLAR